MKKFDVQEKSRGVILFAFNTNEIDYVSIAKTSAQLIGHILNLPVTIITDNDITLSAVNIRPGTAKEWKNVDRYLAYELSPYDETLLIDSDYLMLDDSLLKLFDQPFDYRLMTKNCTPAGPWTEYMGTVGLKYQWATAILFRKTPKAEMLFNMVGRIQRNYTYYTKLYHARSSHFRNDYALTIADNILNGYDQTLDQGIPWPMMTLDAGIESIELKNNLLYIRESEKAYVIPRQNIHVIDKHYLLSDNFNIFVDAICQE